jgi:hypothetical protein
VHATTDDTSHDKIDCFCEELDDVINQFPHYHIKIC